MKDYASMSDQEIGRLVAAAMGMNGGASYNGATLVVRNGVWDIFDPCNNPADAWPIIEGNGITIINDKNSFPRATNDACSFINEQYDDCMHYLDRNPLRAAMIIFLMMKDGEK